MKLTVKIGRTGLLQDAIINEFARVLHQLIYEGHHVAVIHGGPTLPADKWKDAALIALGAQLNQRLLVSFGKAGVPAIGICGGDGTTLRVRTTRFTKSSTDYLLKTPMINPFWIDVICRSGGIPVISNIALGADSRYHCLCADQVASACAISWNADALIFLVDDKGVRNNDGTIMRWLYADQIAGLPPSPYRTEKVLSKLIACHDALQNGVHRTRIFPLSHIGRLSGFFMERLDFGTEVVLPPLPAGQHLKQTANTKELAAEWAAG